MNHLNASDYTVVVEPLSFDEADQAFASWLAKHDDVKRRLANDDIIIDTIRGLDGHSRRRYRIRTEVLKP